LQMHLTINYY